MFNQNNRFKLLKQINKRRIKAMSIGKIFTAAETKNVSSVRLGIFALFVGLFKERLMKHFIEKAF